MIIDTHAHLADEKFDADRDAVLARAQAAGVTTLIEIAESPAGWEAAVQLAEKHPFIYASLGIHPHHAHDVGPAEWPALAQKLRRLLQHPKVVALGEFGLDYFRMQNTQEQQDYLFRRQLELAKELVKPIVIHCFSGSWEDAQAYMLYGFLLGVDAPVTYPSSKLLKEIVFRMPLQRMVLETDSPYLPPQTHRGQRNEPAYVTHVVSALARIRGEDEVALAGTLRENAVRLFGLL